MYVYVYRNYEEYLIVFLLYNFNIGWLYRFWFGIFYLKFCVGGISWVVCNFFRDINFVFCVWNFVGK